MTNPDQTLLTTTEAAGLGSATDGDRPRHPPAASEAQPAPPSDVDSAEAREARGSGTGQELAAGEG